MTVDLAALKTELLTDPKNYGYAGKVAINSGGELAEMLNMIRPGITVGKTNVTPYEILEAINVNDFIASPNILMASWFESLTQFPSIALLRSDGVSNSRVMMNIMAILVNNSQSESRIRALATRKGSRAEQLFGVGVVITAFDVIAALQLT